MHLHQLIVMKFISFIPETASYQVWYPEDFIIDEAEDGIVSITSPHTYSNLTISSYTVNQVVTDSILSDFLQEQTKCYVAQSGLKKIVTNDRIWIEQNFTENEIYWVWYAITKDNQIILASINSTDILSDADRHLYTFMIDKMEIYPD